MYIMTSASRTASGWRLLKSIMGIEVMKNLSCLVLATIGCVNTVLAVSVGYRETDGVSVAAGESVTLDGRLEVSSRGRFLKVGEGTLTMPQEAVDGRVPTTIHVLGGTLALTSDSVAPRDVDNPPSVIFEKAAFWTDATIGNGLVSTNGEADAETGIAPEFAVRWYDRRETDTANPTRWYADAFWTNSPSSPLWGIPPAVKTVDGRRTVYFGGKYSSQCMKFRKGSTFAGINGIYDYFLVLGVTNSLGLVLGQYGDSPASFPHTAVREWPNISNFIFPRADVGPSCYGSRFYLDGVLFDPFYTAPKRGFQLFERHRFDSLGNSGAQAFFTGYDSGSRCEGGDYLSEAIVFTNSLTEAERVAVERYLLTKWDLPHKLYGKPPMQRQYNTIAVASNATLEVTADAGKKMDEFQLSGEGRLVKKGAGTMSIGPSGDVPFTGTLDLQAGAVAVRGGPLPAVTLVSGSRLDSHEIRYSSADPTTAEAQAAAATTVTMQGDAGAGKAVKEGRGPARVRAIADGVKKLTVSAGQLVLDAGIVSPTVSPASAISATIPNHDFEIPFTTGNYNSATPYRQFGNHSASTGWTALNNNCILFTSIPSSVGNQWGTWMSHPCPQGTNVLYVISTGAAYTKVTFPVSGYYQCSVLASYRNRDAAKYTPVDVFLGTTTDTRKVFGSIVCGHNGTTPEDFRRYYFRTPYVTAGVEYVFGVQGRYSVDSGMALDDFRLDLIPYAARTVADYEIPNGDFEQYSAITHPINLPASRIPTGWTCSDNIIVGSTPGAALTLQSTVLSSGRQFTLADVGSSSAQLALMSNSWAETTFTPPAGTYRLRGKIANWPSGLGGLKGSGTVRATVTIGETSTVLGNYSGGHLLTEYIWPTEFSVDGSTPVTLRLEQTAINGVVLLDDFDLLAWRDDELLKDTEIETVTNPSWVSLNPAAPRLAPGVTQSGTVRGYAGTVPGTTDPFSKYWGFNRYSGDTYIFLAENGGVQQTVSIPKAGTYRLTYHERSRLTPGNGANPVRAWIRSADGSYTNFISRSTRYWSTNFVEHAFLFSLPSAGSYVLAFQGMGYNWMNYDREDIESLVDGVSLKYVTETLAETPCVPEKLRIEVAKDAILALDFPGVLKTGPLKLGGTHVVGLVNSDTHPDYICGMGTLDARPSGIVISVK